MKVLALDTATEACSVALLTDAGQLTRCREMARGHAEEILGMVDSVLAEAGIALRALDGIAAGVGPGAFTGVRISVSVAQGLAFGAGVPVVAVTSLEALALQALRVDGWSLGAAAELTPHRPGGMREVVACLDARMGEVYWGCFAADAQRGVRGLGPLAVAAAAAVTPPAGGFLGIGRGFRAYPELLQLPGLVLSPGAAEALPQAFDMALLGRARLAAGEGVDAGRLTPVYVRDKVALTEIERAAAKDAAAKDAVAKAAATTGAASR